jgi:hypothetical protein
MSQLVSIWMIRRQRTGAIWNVADRFGATGVSVADAVNIVCWAGSQREFRPADYLVTEVTPRTLPLQDGFNKHVELNAGPLAVRGCWYPSLTTAPPSPVELEARFRIPLDSGP